MQFNEVEISFPCQGGTLGKSTFQGIKRGNSMTKAIREEKGKVPKSSRKAARDKTMKFLQRGGGEFSSWRT